MHVPSEHDVRIRTLHQHGRGFAADRAAEQPRIVSASADVMGDVEMHAGHV
jgi:hypothetical protein